MNGEGPADENGAQAREQHHDDGTSPDGATGRGRAGSPGLTYDDYLTGDPWGDPTPPEPVQEPVDCLPAALAYAEQGVPIFPCKPLTKEPATRHGFKDATTDQDQIRSWWERTPDANIAMPTGQASGRIVLDPDDGQAGLDALARLQDELGPLPVTLTVRTPGDRAKGKAPGLHLHLAHPGGTVRNSAGKLGPSLDVRGDGGYVMLPGSILADGPYTVETDAPVAEPPDAWASRVRDGRKVQEPARPKVQDRERFATPARTFTLEQARAYVRPHFQALIDAQPGGRNAQLNATAMVVGHFVPHGLDQDEMTARLTETAQDIGLDDDEISATITSGLAAGMAEPYELVQDQEPAQVQKRGQAILDAVMDATELDQLPEPTPLLTGYLNESEAVWLAGKFGTYKSFLALAWSYALATGTPWSGAEVAKIVPVVYVAAEGVTGLRRRLRALERRHGLAVPQGQLTVVRRPVHLERPEEVAALRQVIERVGAKLIVLDTWHRMAGRAEENSSTEQAEPLDVALALRDDYQATVLILDHTGHEQLHARGSSAKEDDVDASWLIRLGKGDREDESRSATTPRTLLHRKAKDEEVQDPGLLRLQVDDQGDATVELSPFSIADQVRFKKPDHADQVLELIAALDEAAVPADTGYRKIEEWDAHRRPGYAATQRAAKEAAAHRRLRATGAAIGPSGRVK